LVTCGTCDAETTRPLCDNCANQLRWDLAETDATLEDLTTTLTRQARTGTTSGRGTGETPLAYHAGASEAHTNLRLTLKHWAGYTLERRADQGVHVQPPFPAKADRLASFLLTHLDWLADQPEAPEAHHAIRGAYAKCRRVVDTAPNMVTLGRCGATFSGVECENPLRARDTVTEVTCRVCSTVWDIQDRRDAMLQEAWDVAVTATEASRMFPDLTADRVRKWRDRGHITETGGTYVVAHLARLARMHATGQRLTHIDKENAA
jgi:hypothetical protein